MSTSIGEILLNTNGLHEIAYIEDVLGCVASANVDQMIGPWCWINIPLLATWVSFNPWILEYQQFLFSSKRTGRVWLVEPACSSNFLIFLEGGGRQHPNTKISRNIVVACTAGLHWYPEQSREWQVLTTPVDLWSSNLALGFPLKRRSWWEKKTHIFRKDMIEHKLVMYIYIFTQTHTDIYIYICIYIYKGSFTLPRWAERILRVTAIISSPSVNQ